MGCGLAGTACRGPAIGVIVFSVSAVDLTEPGDPDDDPEIRQGRRRRSDADLTSGRDGRASGRAR